MVASTTCWTTLTEYFDKYRFESDPLLLREIVRHVAALVPVGTEVLAGLELGGVPIAVALSMETGIPTAELNCLPQTFTRAVLATSGSLTPRKPK